ncbi:hypothetical protein GF314_16245 [bacterium]|nr:hypothetical protein [bacterium]
MWTTIAFVVLATLTSGQGRDWEYYMWGAALAEVDPAAEPSCVFARPDGGGLPLTHAYAPGGAIVDATLTLSLVTSDGDPLVGLPAEDVWLMSTGSGLAPCGWGCLPDGPSDENGQMVWREPLLAGGHTVGESLVIALAGTPMQREFDITVKTPDQDGDRLVNLTDITIFAQALGSYVESCDFNDDGTVNLSDLARFTGGIGRTCP